MATRFVDKDAAGANDGTSWTDAYTTIDAAMNAVAAGDLVLVKGPKTYLETATIDTAGTSGNTITFLGDDASGGAGIGNPAIVTIDGESTRASCLDTTLAISTNTYYAFENFVCVNATAIGVDFTNLFRVTFKLCEANNNSSSGFSVRGSCSFYRCSCDGNAQHGITATTTACSVQSCVASNNTLVGFNNVGSAHGCVAFSNAGDGIKNSSNIAHFTNCTVDGDAKDTDDGYDLTLSSANPTICVNCIAYDCTTGLRHGTADPGRLAVIEHNLVNANTTAYVNTQTWSGEVTSAPDFVNEATGDYRLNSTSPAKAAGTDGGVLAGDGTSYIDIGAIQREEPAGGASVLPIIGG